ncbi:MAG: cytochrome c oxidase accessory protein CcoG [bacterium]|nr:cytochrome c oxidase accessory protein CcoG [bacterium]
MEKSRQLPVIEPHMPNMSATIGSHGKRKWVYQDITKGQWATRRNIVIAVLIVFYLVAPFIKINGNPFVLFDLVSRRFSFFGHTFLATDLYLLALLLVMSVLALFWFSAMFGRLWCGWACPQTVYLEGIFYRVERWIEGNPRQRKELDNGPHDDAYWTRKIFKHGIFWLVATAMSLSFTAYFIGPEASYEMFWTFGAAHPTAMAVAVFITAISYFNFAWFREQFCHFLCPYARIQSVFLDEHSLIVGYDQSRGEPRGNLRPKDPTPKGDCVACNRCVQVCPMGIDIRNGLQLECIQCTACIDACDVVMAKVNRPLGLIRYDSLAGIEHKKHRLVRPRVILYLAVFVLLGAMFTYRLSAREIVDFAVVRPAGTPYLMQEDGNVRNMLQMHFTNTDARTRTVTVKLESPIPAQLMVLGEPIELVPGERIKAEAFIMVPKDQIKSSATPMEFKLMDGATEIGTASAKFLGPVYTGHHDDDDHDKDEKQGHNEH